MILSQQTAEGQKLPTLGFSAELSIGRHTQAKTQNAALRMNAAASSIEETRAQLCQQSCEQLPTAASVFR
jgi:hypothetical protein